MRGRFCGAASAAIVFGMLVAASALAAAPGNDDRAHALALTPASSGALTQSTAEATKELGEGDHAGDQGGASVWFTWTPDFSGPAMLTTSGSTFDTLLEVRGVGGGLVASNDDFSTAAGISTVCFTAASGSPVTIAVDGYAGASGSLHLQWSSGGPGAACPTLPPVLSGDVATPTVGDTLSATFGTWMFGGTPSGQWERCIEYACTRISDATGTSYTVQQRDIGTALRFETTMTVGSDTTTGISDPSGVVGQPASTHANGRVFWVSQRDGDQELYSQLANGSGLLRVTNHNGGDIWPSATADGQAIAWVQESGITVANPDGSSPAVVVGGSAGETPTWSPDEGSRIAYISVGSSASSGIRVTDGTNDRFVVPFAPGVVRSLAWSPDGTRFAFSYRPPTSTNWDIAVVRADGRGAVAVLTSSPIDEHLPAWSPDGQRIAFVRGPLSGGLGAAGDLYVMNADGSNQTLYVNGSSLPVNSVSWSPDGTKLVYSRQVTAGDNDLFTTPAAAPGGGSTVFASGSGGDELPFWATATSFPVTVYSFGSGAGTLTVDPQIPCSGGICDGELADGTQVTATATVGAGSYFMGWNGDCAYQLPTCTFTVNGPRFAGAEFVQLTPPPSVPLPPFNPPTLPVITPGNLKLELTAKTPNLPLNGTDDLVATVSNNGSFNFPQTHLTITLPAGLGLVGPPAADRGSCTGTQTIDCNMETFPSNVSAKVFFSVRATASGPQTVAANVKGLFGEQNTSDNTVNLALQVDAPPAPIVTPPPSPRSTTSTRGVTKNGSAKANTLSGTARNDVLRGLGGNDLLRGLAGADTLLGGTGNDRLFGGDGVDRLVGGSGHDRFDGGAGNDRIESRDGERDVVNCGAGRDTVIADKRDLVDKSCERVTRS